MKNVLKIAILCFALAMLVTLVACGTTETTTAAATDATTTASGDETTTTTTTTTTEEVKTAEVFVNGETDYVIVYDDSNDAIKSAVNTYVTKLKASFKVTITAKGISEVTEPYANEIIVGDLGDKRPCVNTVKAACKTSDWAVSVQNGDVVMYATDDQNYSYMFAALVGEANLTPSDKNLTFNEDFYYHASELTSMNYLQYKSRNAASVNGALVQSLFTYHETTKANGQKLVYRQYVPSNYDPEKEYPVLIVLHGAGERGVDNDKQFGNLILELFKHKTSPIHDAIVIAPQCPENNQWVDTPWANGNYSTTSVRESDELQAVMKVLTGVQETYSVDDGRIYAMGLSMGGFGTWDLLMRHGDVFAAGIPICGGADPSKAAELAKIPIRTFHSIGDPIVPSSGTIAMAEAIEANNPVDFTYVEVEGSNHDCWTMVGRDLSNLEWLFAQTKTK